MKAQRFCLVLLVFAFLLYSGCASQEKYFFGVSEDTPISDLAVIDWGPTRLSSEDGVTIEPVGSERDFKWAFASTFFVSPGNYIVAVDWRGMILEQTVNPSPLRGYGSGPLTVRQRATHKVPISAKPEMKYTLKRIGSGHSEKIVVVETPVASQ